MIVDIEPVSGISEVAQIRYASFEYLILKSIDSILKGRISQLSNSIVVEIAVDIEVDFSGGNIFGDQETLAVVLRDKGDGLDEGRLRNFLSTNPGVERDHLIWRFSTFDFSESNPVTDQFRSVAIDTHHRDQNGVVKRTMRYHASQAQAEVNSEPSGMETCEPGTAIKLTRLTSTMRDQVVQGIPLISLLSAPILAKRMLAAFLPLMLGHKQQLGHFGLKFVSRHWKEGERTADLKFSDLPRVTSNHVIWIEESHPRTGDGLGTYQRFELSHYRIDLESREIMACRVFFCANSRPLMDVTASYLHLCEGRSESLSGTHHMFFVKSNYLDRHINDQHDGIEQIPNDIPTDDYFSAEKLSYTKIMASLAPVIDGIIGRSEIVRQSVA